MKRAVAIDIGSRCAKAAIVEKSARGATLRGFALADIPPEGVTAAFIASLLARVRWNYEPLAMVFPPSETIVREIVVPFTEIKQLEQVVRFEAENYMPSPIEEMALDFIPLGREGDGTRVMVFAARKEDMASRMKLLETAEIDPLMMSVAPAALAEAFRATSSYADDPALLLDLGASTVTAVCVVQGTPMLARVLRLSAEKEQEAALPEAYLTRLGREISRFLAGVPEDQSPKRVWVTGGNAQPELVESLSTALGIPVELSIISPAATLSGVDEEAARRGMIALGTAMSLVAPTGPSANLCKGEFRYRPRIERLRAPLSFLLIALIVLLLVCIAGVEWRRQNVRQMANDVLAREREIWQGVGKGAPQPADLNKAINDEINRLKAETEGARSKIPSAAATFRSILGSVPPNVTITVRNADINPDRAKIEMATDSLADASATADAVTAKTGWVATANNLRFELGKVVFELDVTLQK